MTDHQPHSTSSARPRAKAIAFYFPQLHAIPENDAWWGPGFTDWVNVRAANPLFEGHHQPRRPLHDRYYDQSQIETLRWQIDLAKAHGLHGFCHYHYWFDGKQLLERPTNLILENRSLDLPFSLCWANETWSRRWDGRDHDILQQQKHTPDPRLWRAHFEYLFKAWSDPRAILIDGRPLFLIYRPQLISNLEDMLSLWRELAHQRGLKGLFLVAVKPYEYQQPEVFRHFDAVVKFQPFEAILSPRFLSKEEVTRRAVPLLRRLPARLQNWLRRRYDEVKGPQFFDYDRTWQTILNASDEPDILNFEGAFMDWDNTARYGNRARIFKGASPERFEYWFGQLVDRVVAQGAEENRFVFINAWNEWAEGTYLEPDSKHGYGYIEALRNCLVPAPRSMVPSPDATQPVTERA